MHEGTQHNNIKKLIPVSFMSEILSSLRSSYTRVPATSLSSFRRCESGAVAIWLICMNHWNNEWDRIRYCSCSLLDTIHFTFSGCYSPSISWYCTVVILTWKIQKKNPTQLDKTSIQHSGFKPCLHITKNKPNGLNKYEVMQPLLSHLSLLDNVVGVTAWEAGTLQKVHDIILTATITDSIKQVITWIHRVVTSCDYRGTDSLSTAILTSPSSCLRSTGPSLHRWHDEGRLLLYQSGGWDIYDWSGRELHCSRINWLCHSISHPPDYRFTPS